jgi:3-oxoacyl-[acyl-carrier-protein] synthase-3
MQRARVIATGSYLPKKIMTNDDLAKFMDTSHEWIYTRTGINQRHVAAENEKTSDLATKACEAAIKTSGLKASDMDFVICATTTPDQIFPSTASVVQANLEMKGFAFDLQAVCSGFVFAINVAKNFIESGQAKRGLVVGAETMTKLIDWDDRSTAVLFGDGAGAVVLEATEGKGTLDDEGILDCIIKADGTCHDVLYMTGGPGSTGDIGKISMNGRELFRHAVEKLGNVIVELFEKTGIQENQVDWFVPHQANARIIMPAAKKMGLEKKTILTVGEHANTSAASIPLALDVAVKDGRLKKGDLVLIDALGAGLHWGAGLIRW